MAASTQVAHKENYTFFPEFVSLTPMDAFLGATPFVKSFSDINKTNSIIFNQFGDEGNFIINEEGIDITKTKSSAEIKALVRSGIGSLDDRTIERMLEVVINVNGRSHELDAVVDGGNPITEVDNNIPFEFASALGAIASISIDGANSSSLDGVYPLVIAAPPSGGVQATANATVDTNIVTGVVIVNPGSGYVTPPAITALGGATFTATLDVKTTIAAAGYLPKERLVKTKWVMFLVSPLGDEEEGKLYVLCPKLVAVDKDNLNSLKGEKASTILSMRGLVILDPRELAAMKAIYPGVNETELMYSFNAANVEYSAS